MIKKLKPGILLLLYFLFLHDGYGQIKNTVEDYLSQKFIKYCESVPREEIFVHTDRQEYISGELLWFNIYVINRQSLKPSLNSKIVYFEVLNPENRPVAQKRILIDKGYGPGQVTLPDTLSTGTYTIRAYTSWMKNFLPYNCFMQDIKVYNAFNNKSFHGKVISDNYPKTKEGSKTGLKSINAGVTMNVNNLKPENLEISVNTNESFRSANGNLVYLIIQTRGRIDRISSESLTQDITRITIPGSILASGINQITLFDSKGQPICERFSFTPGKESLSVSILTADSSRIRSKVSLEIEPGVDLLLGAAMNLSISVAPVTNMQDIPDFNDYLIFGSEFGIHPSDILGNKKISELPAVILDSLLLSLRSNWIEWGEILSNRLPKFRYKSEKEENFIFGKLLNSDQQPAGDGNYLLLSSPGKEAVFQYARTDINGNFDFSVPIDNGLKDLIIQPDDIANKQKIKLESSFSDQYFNAEAVIDLTYKQAPAWIQKWSINYQVQKIYGSAFLGESLNQGLPPLKPRRFYGKPDLGLIMDDYIKLPVMQEVFFELIPGVFLKNRKTGYNISIADPVSNKPYETAPGLMIDGVMINNPSIIANLDPEIVEKIDVVTDKYFVGDYLFYGLINVISKAGDYNCVTLPDYAVRFSYRVFDPVSKFSSPDYSSDELRNNRKPDFRNTLFWNPSIIPDKVGKLGVEFWTSDIISDYIINIQGFTQEGKIFGYKKIISVK
jgi:hypothetical protein